MDLEARIAQLEAELEALRDWVEQLLPHEEAIHSGPVFEDDRASALDVVMQATGQPVMVSLPLAGGPPSGGAHDMQAVALAKPVALASASPAATSESSAQPADRGLIPVSSDRSPGVSRMPPVSEGADSQNEAWAPDFARLHDLMEWMYDGVETIGSPCTLRIIELFAQEQRLHPDIARVLRQLVPLDLPPMLQRHPTPEKVSDALSALDGLCDRCGLDEKEFVARAMQGID